jgi:hypothetical protein
MTNDTQLTLERDEGKNAMHATGLNCGLDQ